MAANIDSVFQRLDERSPVDLLMVGCTQNQANQCATALRNSGQAVHVESAETAGALAQLLETEPGDLVIVNTDSHKLPKDMSIDTVRDVNPSASIILLARDPSSLIDFAAEQEVRDLLRTDDMAHLALAVRREHQTLVLRQELAHLRHRVQESERRFDSLMGKSRDAIAYVHEGMHIHANNVYCEMFGIDNIEDVEGLPLMDLIGQQARKKFKKVLRNNEENQSFTTQVDCQGTDGRTFTATMEFSPAQVDGEPCTQIVIRDQSLHEELQARIDELTNRDSHTRLFNRQAFMERLEGALSRNDLPHGSGLIQVSINNFAELRDNIGIESTDRLLLAVASVLREQMPGAHTIARFGDHDFVAMQTTNDSLTEAGERCLSALRSHDFVSASGILDTPIFSIGVTPLPEGSQVSAYELVNRSCRATKQAQADEANQLVIFNEVETSTAAPEQGLDPAIVELIDHALESDGFRLLYQPIVSLQGDTRENYSVLLRLLDRDGEERQPEAFWSHAQNASRLAEIDRWVVRNAISELVKHRRKGKKINFHIMLSRDGITDESMLLWVCDCLREFKAKGAWLTFQFNEADLRNRIQPARKLIEGLKKINCRVAINHFNDNPSSDTLLKHLPVDTIKLSPEFMSNLAGDAAQQDRLSEVNQRLQAAGLKTIASGVEDANSLAILWNVGVNYIQGYFLQEPSSTIAFDDN